MVSGNNEGDPVPLIISINVGTHLVVEICQKIFREKSVYKKITVKMRSHEENKILFCALNR